MEMGRSFLFRSRFSVSGRVESMNRFITFAMICETRPPSAGNGPHERLQDAIRDQTGRAWSGKPFLTERFGAGVAAGRGLSGQPSSATILTRAVGIRYFRSPQQDP